MALITKSEDVQPREGFDRRPKVEKPDPRDARKEIGKEYCNWHRKGKIWLNPIKKMYWSNAKSREVNSRQEMIENNARRNLRTNRSQEKKEVGD